ncbi:MAG: hypothetical protein WBE18_02765, partial [Gammaproteobacteria bacterium]
MSIFVEPVKQFVLSYLVNLVNNSLTIQEVINLGVLLNLAENNNEGEIKGNQNTLDKLIPKFINFLNEDEFKENLRKQKGENFKLYLIERLIKDRADVNDLQQVSSPQSTSNASLVSSGQSLHPVSSPLIKDESGIIVYFLRLLALVDEHNSTTDWYVFDQQTKRASMDEFIEKINTAPIQDPMVANLLEQKLVPILETVIDGYAHKIPEDLVEKIWRLGGLLDITLEPLNQKQKGPQQNLDVEHNQLVSNVLDNKDIIQAELQKAPD